MRDRIFATSPVPRASLGRLLAAWLAYRARQRAETALRGLGTRELLDLGLGYGEIGHVVRHGRGRR